MAARVSYRRDDGIGLIEIDNPPVNALSRRQKAALRDRQLLAATVSSRASPTAVFRVIA
jgi:hypothetical protein